MANDGDPVTADLAACISPYLREHIAASVGSPSTWPTCRNRSIRSHCHSKPPCDHFLHVSSTYPRLCQCQGQLGRPGAEVRDSVNLTNVSVALKAGAGNDMVIECRKGIKRVKPDTNHQNPANHKSSDSGMSQVTYSTKKEPLPPSYCDHNEPIASRLIERAHPLDLRLTWRLELSKNPHGARLPPHRAYGTRPAAVYLPRPARTAKTIRCSSQGVAPYADDDVRGRTRCYRAARSIADPPWSAQGG